MIRKFFKHWKTVRTHRKEVRRLCFKCGLYKQGLFHDLSKYSPAEFIPSVRYWTGNKSPIDNEIEDIGYSHAWLHHKGRNKHHYEYWIDEAHGTPNILCDMPFHYIVEMWCDRVAACKTYLGDAYTDKAPFEYALRKEDREKELMSGITYSMLLRLLNDLVEYGEDRVCLKIKKNLKMRKSMKKELQIKEKRYE